MKITFLSDKTSWKNEAIGSLAQKLRKRRHKVTILHETGAVPRGDILFILGFFKIVPRAVLGRNRTNIVVHESALPKGRGWSPVHWLVEEGSKVIPLTLFEAIDKVDAGKVYLRDRVPLRDHELLPEIRLKVGKAMMDLCSRFVSDYPAILRKGTKQKGRATYYPRRGPGESELSLSKSLGAQFNRLRVVDNDHYPAFFRRKGITYTLKIEKSNS